MINNMNTKPVQGCHIQLIDALAQQLGCFVSDLRTPEYANDVKHAVNEIPFDAYPLPDWEHFYTYLTGIGCTTHEIPVIKAEILACEAYRSL